jgi:hypothetical protein
VVQRCFIHKFAAIIQYIIASSKNDGILWSFRVLNKTPFARAVNSAVFDTQMFTVEQVNPAIRLTENADTFASMTVADVDRDAPMAM